MHVRAIMLSFAAGPLLAQAPQAPDAAYFSQDAKTLMALCSEEARALARPRDGHLLAEYGDVWLTRGDRAKAGEAFAKARRIDPDDPQTHRLIGLAWLRHGCGAEALTAYKAMTNVNLAGRYERLKNLLSKAAVDLISAGFTKEATVYMEQSYQLDGRDEHNFLEFGRAAWFADQRDLAATYFARAAKAAPKDEDVWIEISNLLADHIVAHRKPKAD